MKYLYLLPFFYTAGTRARSPRDLTYLILTQIVPGILIVYRIDSSTFADALVAYLVGYCAFISIYEMGYLGNDLWDAHRDNNGRRRFDFFAGPGWIASFIVIRLSIWVLISLFLRPADIMIWLMLFAALASVFFLHNLFQHPGVRTATFTQLCLLRYSLPIFYSTGTYRAAEIVIIAVLLYFPFRYLGYLDSKGWLNMHGRRISAFGTIYLTAAFPLILALGGTFPDRLLWEVWFFSLSVQLIFVLVQYSSVRIRTIKFTFGGLRF